MDQPGHRAEKPKIRVVAGREILFDPDGFLINSDQWTEDVAEALAREKGLEGLGPDQWRVIRFLRDYYLAQGKAPLGRDLRKGVGLSLLEIENLFPGGLKFGARLMAGIPNPRGCM